MNSCRKFRFLTALTSIVLILVSSVSPLYALPIQVEHSVDITGNNDQFKIGSKEYQANTLIASEDELPPLLDDSQLDAPLDALPPPSSSPLPPLPSSLSNSKDRANNGFKYIGLTDPGYVLPRVAPKTKKVVKETIQEEKIVFTLSSSTPKDKKEHKKNEVVATPLKEERIKELLAKLPPLPKQKTTAFRRPEILKAEKKPSVKVDKISQTSNDDSKQNTNTDSPLTVLRKKPVGKTTLKPTISLTFSQPMVPVGAPKEINAKQQPIKIIPTIDGDYQWLGTQTLLIKPYKDLKQATEYKLTVPSGTKSISDKALERDYTWTFQTIRPEIYSICKVSSNTYRTILVAKFNQKIDQNSFLKIGKFVLGSKQLGIRLATGTEIKQVFNSQKYYDLSKINKTGDLFAFTYVGKLRKPVLGKSVDFKFELPIGLKGQVGQLTSSENQIVKLEGYENSKAFEVYKIEPADKVLKGRSTRTIALHCTNKIKGDSKDIEKCISVSPKVNNLRISHYNYQKIIYLSGAFEEQQKYKVTLSNDLVDEYGQKLTKKSTWTFESALFDPSFDLTNVSRYGRNKLVIPKSKSPSLPFQARNIKSLKVTAYKVSPVDWRVYNRSSDDIGVLKSDKYSSFKKFKNRTIDTRKSIGKLYRSAIDMRPYLNDGVGNVVLIVEPEYDEISKFSKSFSDYERKANNRVVWLNYTNIGIDSFGVGDKFGVFISSLSDGKPIENAEVILHERDGSKTTKNTSSDGLVSFKKQSDFNHVIPEVRIGEDSTFNSEFTRASHEPFFLWYKVTDRNLYKPGEIIKVKGWVRQLSMGPQEKVRFNDNEVKEVKYEAFSHAGTKIKEEKIQVDTFGGFNFSIQLPKKVELGAGSISLEVIRKPGSQYFAQTNSSLSFQIKEFRRPKFNIKVTSNDTAKVFVGDKLNFSAKANYYAGPPLSKTDLDWSVNAKPTNYSPPGWSDYSFNTNNHYGFYPGEYYNANKTFQLKGKTDILGRHVLNLNLLKSLYEKPLSVVCTAQIVDIDRQIWKSEKSFIAHPANIYIGLKKDKYYYEPGDKVDFSVIAVDLDGKAKLNSKVEIDITRTTNELKNRKLISETKSVYQESFQSQRLPKSIKFQLDKGGSYSIIAKSIDDKGRPNQTKINLQVFDEAFSWNSKNTDQLKVGLDLDKKEYSSGETANLIIQAPFAPAYGYMSIAHNGLVSSKPIAIKSKIQKLSIPVSEELVPEAKIAIVLNGTSGQFCSGTTNIVIPPKSKDLNVKIDTSTKEYQPGSKVLLNLKVRDAKGQAGADTQIALAVVDESILALTDYKWEDPKTYFHANSKNKPKGFYHALQSFLESKHSRNSLVKIKDVQPESEEKKDLEASSLREADDLAALPPPSALPPAPAPGAADGFAAAEMPTSEPQADSSSKGAFSLRKDMRALAYFTPGIVTDEDGSAQVSFKLPDSVTRYRIMAVAAQGEDKFGLGEASITAKMPITIKPSAPRFANFTDSFELPVVLQNQTDRDRIIEVVSRANNLSYTETQGKKVKIRAQDRVEVRFAVKTILPGETTIQFAAVSGELSDATSLNLPIFSPITEETIATYGSFEKGSALQKVQIPDEIAPNMGSVTIDTSCTQVPTLQDAFIYIKGYEHLCSEQLSARVLSLCGLEPFWEQLRAKDGSKLNKAVIKNIIQNDVDELAKRQDYGGNVGLWKLGGSKWPFVSLQVARAFVAARACDIKVSDEAINNSKRFLKDSSNFKDSNYGLKTSLSLNSYALFVRSLMNDKDPEKANKLINDFETQPKTADSKEISNDVIAWLLPVLHKSSKHKENYKKLLTIMNNRVEETAANAFIVGPGYGDNCYLLFYSENRANAAILEALLLTDPENTLIPKLARGLYGKAKNGKWRGTQENAYVLLALSRYISKYESTLPDFVSRVWMGKDLISKETLASGKKTQSQLQIPLDFISKEDRRSTITLSKDGDGRLYYRVGLNYSLAKFDQKKLDRGFSIERSFEALNNKDDVSKDATGLWHFKPGALIKVKIKVTCPATRYHIALTDPLAAGTEAVNTDLKGSAITEEKKNWWDFWAYNWFDHQNLRDDRAEVYASRIDGGEYNYSYNIQATTPGEFIIPPTRVEEMYTPETFARGDTARVKIGD